MYANTISISIMSLNYGPTNMSEKPSRPPLESRMAATGESHESHEQVKVDEQMKSIVKRLGELVGRAIAERQSTQDQGVDTSLT